MIDFDIVLKDFISISGLSEDDAKKQSNLINLSIDYVVNNLKPGVDINSNLNLLSMLSASVKPKNMELPGVGFDIGSENARMGFPLGDDRTLMSTSPVPSCTVCLEMLIM